MRFLIIAIKSDFVLLCLVINSTTTEFLLNPGIDPPLPGSGINGQRKSISMLQELQKFAIFIIHRFIEVAQKNRKSYMELLFWKTTRDATEVVDGYNAESTNKKVSRAVWTEVEEDELRTLFMEHQTNKYSQGKLFMLSSFYGSLVLIPV